MRPTPVAPVVTLVAALTLVAVRPSLAQGPSESHGANHGGHIGTQQPPGPDAPAPSPAPHDAHQHGAGDAPPQELPPFIRRLTDEDRRAAFPDVKGHTVHDHAVHYFVLFDQLEWQGSRRGSGLNVDSKGWVGLDRDRLWVRAEGTGEDGRVGDAQAHVLYGRPFSRWWDVVAGIRQDFRPGPAQTWAAIGVQGLAPYWFEVEATAYVGASGRTHFRFETEYELLLTNRLILQPLVEAEIYGKSDPERGIGAGLSTTDAGLRIRYEIRRELAPYIGVTWSRKHGKTADFARAGGEDTGGPRVVAGLRVWF